MSRSAACAAITVALLAAGSLGLTCGPGPAPPVVETCEPIAPTPRDAGVPTDGVLDSLELGTLDVNGVFYAYVDDKPVSLSFGGQGSTMLVTHLRVRGAAAPACLEQRTTMTAAGGEVIASESAPLPTDAAPDGARVTTSMYLVYDREPGVPVHLHAEAGGLTRDLTVWIDYDPRTFIDAGVDAP